MLGCLLVVVGPHAQLTEVVEDGGCHAVVVHRPEHGIDPEGFRKGVHALIVFTALVDVQVLLALAGAV